MSYPYTGEFFCFTEEGYSYGSHDTGDPNTTNLYIGNINPAVRKICLICVTYCRSLSQHFNCFTIYVYANHLVGNFGHKSEMI